VSAVNFEKNAVLLELGDDKNTTVEKLKPLSRELARAVGSPNGKIAILTPTPETQFIGLRIPYL
jgi:hypothetical protein